MTIFDFVEDNTIHIDTDNASEMMESLESEADISQGFKYFYVGIIGVTGTLLAFISLLMTTAVFQIVWKISKSFFVLLFLSIIGYTVMFFQTGELWWYEEYIS